MALHATSSHYLNALHLEKDDPLLLLEKPSYKTVVLKVKPAHLNCILGACCYTQENSYKLYKWIPYDDKKITVGMSGKRIMKIKEKSRLASRCLVPKGYRSYETQYIAENTRQLIFTMTRDFRYTFLGFQRPTATIYCFKELKSKNLTGLKRMPYREIINETQQTLNTQTGLNESK